MIVIHGKKDTKRGSYVIEQENPKGNCSPLARGGLVRGGGEQLPRAWMEVGWWDWETNKTGPQSREGHINVRNRHKKQFMVPEDMQEMYYGGKPKDQTAIGGKVNL